MKVSILFLFKILSLFILLEYSINAEDSKKIQAILETTAGKITLDLFPQVAPKAVENFVTHINNGYYNGTIFHRTIRKFMIQGGDPTRTGRGGESIWGQDFEDEIVQGYTFDKAGI